MQSTRESRSIWKTFSIDDRDMTKYVIGAFSELDAPLNPSAKGARNLGAWLSGMHR